MSTQVKQLTTTVRVSVETRGRLAAQAKARGVSIAALVAGFARQADRDAMFEAERDATRADARTAAVREEDQDWAETAEDGLA